MATLIELLTSSDSSNVKLALALRNSFSTEEWYNALLEIYHSVNTYGLWDPIPNDVTWFCEHNKYEEEFRLFYKSYSVVTIRGKFLSNPITPKKYRTKKRLNKILENFEKYLDENS